MRNITFDFEAFKKHAETAYNRIDGLKYGLDEVLFVFRNFFFDYELFRGEPHPNITVTQLERIIYIMPYLDMLPEDIAAMRQWNKETYGKDEFPMSDVNVYEYSDIIRQYFNTIFKRGCDYRINHFFKSNIRYLRYYEALRANKY